MNGIPLKPEVLGIVIIAGALVSSQVAAAQDFCTNRESPQGVAVRLSGYKPPSDPSRVEVKIAKISLNPGKGPKLGQEVVFGAELGQRWKMEEFRDDQYKSMTIPCRVPRFIDGPRPELYGGTCWAVFEYDAGDESCWHLRVRGEPTTPPFDVSIGPKTWKSHPEGAEGGWNVERDLRKENYIQVKIYPLDETPGEPLLFETGPKEIGEGKVPKTIDCKDILGRIIQSQKTCNSACESEALDRYLVPYLGNPPHARGRGASAAGEALAARKAWLQEVDEAWKGKCLLPLTSLTFESIK